MAIRNCNFCGAHIEPGTGILFVMKDGNLVHFCTTKCQVNMIEMHRVPSTVRWINEYHNIKEMKKQSTKS